VARFVLFAGRRSSLSELPNGLPMCRRRGSIELPLSQSCAVGTIGLLDAPDVGSEFDDAVRGIRWASGRSSLVVWSVVITQPELIAVRRPLSTDRGPPIALS